MGLCWQMPKFIVWRLWSIYFDHHLPLKPSIGKRRKQSCIPNNILLLLIQNSINHVKNGAIYEICNCLRFFTRYLLHKPISKNNSVEVEFYRKKIISISLHENLRKVIRKEMCIFEIRDLWKKYAKKSNSFKKHVFCL